VIWPAPFARGFHGKKKANAATAKVQGFDPVCDGNDIHHNHQQQGSQHTGRWTRFSSTGGILILHDTIHSREIEFSETEVDLSNCRRLGSLVDPIHASNSIQKPSVVEVRVDYGFHA